MEIMSRATNSKSHISTENSHSNDGEIGTREALESYEDELTSLNIPHVCMNAQVSFDGSFYPNEIGHSMQFPI